MGRRSGTEHIEVRRLDDLGDVELHRGQRVVDELPLHAHREALLAQIDWGKRELWLKDTKTVLDTGAVFFVPPRQPHGGCSSPPGWSFHAFYIGPGELEPFGRPVFGQRTTPQIRSRVIARLLGSVIAQLDALAPLALAEQWTRLLHQLWLGGELRSSAAPSRTECRAVGRARQLLETRWREPVRLDALAQEADLSKFHLLRVFKREVGFSPHAYQTQLRVQHAKQRLAEGTRVSTLAFETGFADQAHFTRTFRASVGVTPGQYALAVRRSHDRSAVDRRARSAPGRE